MNRPDRAEVERIPPRSLGTPPAPATLPAGAGAPSPVFAITVYGTPAPQGSKRHLGRGILVESSQKVKPWREAVKQAALAELGRGEPEPVNPRLDVPLMVEMVFTLERPASAPKMRIWPDRTPDLSKLIRSTEDALTDAGVWRDDARVVRYRDPRKVYTGSDDPDVLRAPGAVIRIWVMWPEVAR